MGIIGALDDDFRALPGRKCIDPVDDPRVIGFHTALLAHALPVNIDACGAQQLLQVDRNLHRLAGITEH